MVVNISAKANPSVTTKGYSWTRRGALLTNVDGNTALCLIISLVNMNVNHSAS